MKIVIEKFKQFHFFVTNFDCDNSLTNRDFLNQKMLDYEKLMKRRNNVIKIRNIENVNLNINEYLFVNFRIFEVAIDDNFVVINFIKHFYIVDNLKIKMLLDNDILKFEQMILNIFKKRIIIENCQNMIVKLTIINRDTSIKRVTRFAVDVKISIRFNTIISFKLRDKSKLLFDRNFMFVSQRIDRLKFDDDVFSHIIDAHTNVVMIQNVNDKNVFLSKNCRIKIIQNYKKKDCYLTSTKNIHFIVNFENHKSTFQN